MPPCSDLASPMEEMVTSILLPERKEGAISAVIMTAATLPEIIWLAGTVIPKRWSALARLCRVCASLPSPVPARPLTRPYPTSWFSRAPSMIVRSLRREGVPASGSKGAELPPPRAVAVRRLGDGA